MADTQRAKRTKWVSIESPYMSWLPWKTVRNYQYALLAYKNETRLGNMPFASHITFTQFVLAGCNSCVGGDGVSEIIFHKLSKSGATAQCIGREECLNLTDEVRKICDEIVVYDEFGTSSSGVQRAIKLGQHYEIPIVYKQLPPDLKREIIGQSVKSTIVPLFLTTLSLAGAFTLCKWCRDGARFLWSI